MLDGYPAEQRGSAVAAWRIFILRVGRFLSEVVGGVVSGSRRMGGFIR